MNKESLKKILEYVWDSSPHNKEKNIKHAVDVIIKEWEEEQEHDEADMIAEPEYFKKKSSVKLLKKERALVCQKIDKQLKEEAMNLKLPDKTLMNDRFRKLDKKDSIVWNKAISQARKIVSSVKKEL